METCSVCGYDIIPGDSFCTNCGVRHNRTPAQASPDAYARAATGTAPATGAVTATAAAVNSQLAAADLYLPPEQVRTAPDGLPPAAVDMDRASVPAGFSVPQRAAVCLGCGQAWTGSQACTFCGQVWGLPKGITLSSAGRRFGGYLLEGLLLICTLGIGWIIWTLVVWARGQTPAKQVLGMRVVRLDTRAHAGWGRMFLRDFIGKLLVSLTFGLLFIGGVIADCWLLWDKDKQELWDKIAGTVVVNDPEKVLIPSA